MQASYCAACFRYYLARCGSKYASIIFVWLRLSMSDMAWPFCKFEKLSKMPLKASKRRGERQMIMLLRKTSPFRHLPFRSIKQ